MTPIEFHATPEPINWPARVAAHLDTIAPITAQDVALIEAAALGYRQVAHKRQQRLLALLRGARDACFRVTMDGQAALLDAVRGRV